MQCRTEKVRFVKAKLSGEEKGCLVAAVVYGGECLHREGEER